MGEAPKETEKTDAEEQVQGRTDHRHPQGRGSGRSDEGAMKVALVPGIAFGDDNTVRLSYACGLDVIKEGLDRFETFCKSH